LSISGKMFSRRRLTATGNNRIFALLSLPVPAG
jgi:hypothetical protein